MIFDHDHGQGGLRAFNATIMIMKVEIARKPTIMAIINREQEPRRKKKGQENVFKQVLIDEES